MTIEQILHDKGHKVHTIGEDRSIQDAVDALVRHNIGALVVVSEERPVGILTERDVLQLTATRPRDLDSVDVASVMTRDVITATPDADLSHGMEVMTENRVRHLPIVDDGRLVGIVSIGDLVNACLGLAEEEIDHLKSYIRGAR